MRLSRSWPLVLAAAFSVAAFAQAPGKEVVPCGVFTPEAPPCAEPARPAGTIALLDGSAITLGDLDKETREKVEGLKKAVAEARQAAVDAEIGDRLLAVEAKRRKIAAEELYWEEVALKTPAPSEAEIKAEFDAHPAWFKDKSLDEMRPSILGLVRARKEKERSAEFLKALRARIPVTDGESVNGPKLKRTSVLATVGGRPITLASVASRIDAELYEVRLMTWYREKTAVDKLLHDRLLAREAEKRRTTPDAVTSAEVTEKIKPATDAELAKFYEENRRRFHGSLAEKKSEVAEAWTSERKRTLEREFDDRLSAGHAVKLLFEKPAPPTLTVDSSVGPARGDANAPVTIVEFGDFECPPCGLMYERMEEAVKPYGSKVRFVFRNFPMPFHPSAPKAAEAALAAQAQGRFWAYADVLFKHQSELDVASLKRYAAEVGLDAARFAQALDGGRFARAVKRDQRAGERYGIQGTPSFFINGVPLGAYEVKGIRAAIDAALARAAKAAAFAAAK